MMILTSHKSIIPNGNVQGLLLSSIAYIKEKDEFSALAHQRSHIVSVQIIQEQWLRQVEVWEKNPPVARRCNVRNEDFDQQRTFSGDQIVDLEGHYYHQIDALIDVRL